MAGSPRFWDRMSKRYARRPVPDEQAYRKKLEVTQAYFHPDMEVLEFGCGTGSTALAHAPYVKHIHAIDVSSKMLEIARRKAETAGITNVKFERSSIEELPLSGRTFGAVLGLNILHLIEDLDDVIARIHSVLGPEGVFVSSTPCPDRPLRWLKALLACGRFLRLLPLVQIFSEEALRTRLTDAGFHIDYRWQPGPGKPVFIVAKKAAPMR